MPSRPAAARPARTPRAEESAAAIKAAALIVIGRDGYAQCRIVDIAREAGRGIGTFYAYFETKDALLEALAEDFRRALAARIRMPEALRDDPLRHLQGTIRAFAETFAAHRPAAIALFQAAMHDPRFAALWRRLRADGVRVSAARIRLAQRHGFCAGLDPNRAATALCAMVEFACFEWAGGLGAAPDPDGDAIVDTLTKLMVHAIGWRRDLTRGDEKEEDTEERQACDGDTS